MNKLLSWLLKPFVKTDKDKRAWNAVSSDPLSWLDKEIGELPPFRPEGYWLPAIVAEDDEPYLGITGS